jgi:hypothetical protein
MGSFLTMGSDVFRFAGNLCREQVSGVVSRPLDWRSHGMCFGIFFSLPLVPVALAGAYLHFVYEERFNENLLFDLVAHRARTLAHVPELAA